MEGPQHASEQARVVLGVDGGATKTACVAICQVTRQAVAQASAGPSNWSSVGKEEALQALRCAVSDTLAECGKPWGAVAAVCLGMAGVDTPQDQAALTHAIQDWFPQDTLILAYNDAVPALASGTGGVLEGCVLIAGTGSIAYAVLPDGSSARVAGCGPAFLDGGCGYDIGQKGLCAAAKASDGRGPPTQLLHSLSQQAAVDGLAELVRWVYAEPGWARVASLAPAVMHCADMGDRVARQIMQEGVADLVTMVQAAVKQLRMPPKISLVMAGGMLRCGNSYTKICHQALLAKFPQADVVFPQVDAATGAALLACKQLQDVAAAHNAPT